LLSIPFLTATLYLFHPVHSEVVANIKGRDEIMTAIGALGAMYFALRYLPSRKVIWLLLSGISMFLGLMSKENALTFLAVIPLDALLFYQSEIERHFHYASSFTDRCIYLYQHSYRSHRVPAV
jgi:predicted membrane-bound mannosyltransferase